MMKLSLSLSILIFSLTLQAKLPDPSDQNNSEKKKAEQTSYILCRDAADGVIRVESGPCPNGLPPIPRLTKEKDGPIRTTELIEEEEEQVAF